MSPSGFEPVISAEERPQTYALDLAATGTGIRIELRHIQIRFKHLPAGNENLRTSGNVAVNDLVEVLLDGRKLMQASTIIYSKQGK